MNQRVTGEKTEDAKMEEKELYPRIVRYTWIMRGTAVAAVIAALLVPVLFGASAPCLVIASILLAAGLGGAYCMHARRKRIIKYSVVSRIIHKYFASTGYRANRTIPDEWLTAAGFAEKWSQASVSDYFEGSWKNCSFEFGDLRVQAPALKNTPSEKLFTGQIYRIRLPKPVRIPVMIRERDEVLSQDILDARRNSDRFFLTGNDQFDRQFEVRFGDDNRASGIAEDCRGMTPDDQRAYVHSLIDPVTPEIIEADRYATSQTTMRAVDQYLYIMIANDRDTFEFRAGDEFHVDLMVARFNEEAQAMASYLDLITQCFPGERA